MNWRNMNKSTKRAFLFGGPLAIALSAAFVVLAAGLSYFQGFETDTNGWEAPISRVSSGTNGIVSASGSWHAQVGSGAFTRWGGYGGIAGCSGNACASQFPQNGYVTAVDIYLEASSTTLSNDTRFDFSSAINDPIGNHRRDFAFNAGFYNDTDATGEGPRFVITASNNTGRSNSNPKNPARDPFTITAEGWYTFQHTFLNDGNGVLKVELSIKDEAGTVLHTWTLSDPSDTMNGTVGSNRYGFFATQELTVLGIDNASRYDVLSIPADKEQCKKDGWKQVVNSNNETFKNQGQCVKFVTTGK
jgi:hypothetical protein